MLRGVWCRGCKVAWHADVLEAPVLKGAVNAAAKAVRCPVCRCPRRVAFTGDEEKFRETFPAVAWKKA